MLDDKLERKIEKREKVGVISEISYEGKEYIKAVKRLENGIKYIYYELSGRKVKEVEDERLISYFKENYEIDPSDIMY